MAYGQKSKCLNSRHYRRMIALSWRVLSLVVGGGTVRVGALPVGVELRVDVGGPTRSRNFPVYT